MDGIVEGIVDGSVDGKVDGSVEGRTLGSTDGIIDGKILGNSVLPGGSAVGSMGDKVGLVDDEGFAVGPKDGN